jgi:hypothetical protein
MLMGLSIYFKLGTSFSRKREKGWGVKTCFDGSAVLNKIIEDKRSDFFDISSL